MRVEELAVYSGRNVYSHHPVVKVRLNLEHHADKTTADIPLFTDRLLSLLPSLRDHHCSRGYPGGFVERLREGTYLGHVVEHVLLELQNLAGFPAIYGKTCSTDDPAVYEIVAEYKAAAAAREAAYQAVEIVNCLLLGDDPPRTEAITARLKELAARYELGPTTAALVRAAQERGLPVLRLDDRSLVQVGYGVRQRRVEAALTSLTSCLAVDIAGDKTRTKEILRRAGVTVPEGRVARSEEEAVAALAELGAPVVVKPECGNQGKGVSLNLKTVAEVRAAYTLARNWQRRVLVEKYVAGRHLRVLVVGGKVAAVAERLPAHVVGDGRHNLRELVDITNADPRRGIGHENVLTKIAIDPVVLMVLARRGLNLDYVPAAGETVFLRENANLSTGGTARDLTDQVAAPVKMVAERAARAVGLDVAGVDLVVADPADSGSAVTVIEVNAAPGLRMHLAPCDGKARPVAEKIISHLFPPGTGGRIPLVSVTGTNGKTTTVRLIAHLLALTGRTVGFTSTDGVFIGGQCVWQGDNAGFRGARLVLEDPTVEAAVLETARGGLIRDGLAYDWADVGVITNISEDHLGQYGIETLEDLAHVKSLVIEAVRDDGCAVLNADDPLVASLAARARCPVIYFSLTAGNAVVRRQLAAGGRVVLVREGKVLLAEGEEVEYLCSARRIPLTLHGTARHNLANVLAATAAAWGLGLPREVIRQGLRSFYPDLTSNPGRVNLLRVGGARLLIDYGHNVASYRSTLEMARRLARRRLLGVIGVPGDRPDELVERVGRTAAEGFDLLFIKEDEDRRGRQAGEIAELLLKGARAAGFPSEHARIILREEEALQAALAECRRGDLVVIFYEKLDRVLKVVSAVRAASPPAPAGLAELGAC
ncbi:MAG TPA: cyanophycin synthetase [Firmicutes bacterium]|nr:cyanophycin synthetase [Bacillota bacterium]MDK2927720.1 cyanophycin synthetase [Bacillota bacterium]HHV57120.1 cyanophycin synthetase [Bacillota bacterium]